MRKKGIFTAIVCSLLISQPVFSQDYLWPTDASRHITSSFAETRPRRMHAAIDIKTWNRTGYKIFAVRDGYVQRIRVSPFGYGRAIYLKLDTGEIALYAHLSGFNAQLQKFVDTVQEKNGRYRVDRYLKPGRFPVKQGDFLGYTGETGIGVPHLHFEMRDAENRPFNPFLRGYRIEDHIPPVVQKLAVIPLNFGARVMDDFQPVLLKTERVDRGEYRVEKAFSIEGDIGLGLSCFDMADGVRNRFQVYKIRLFIDGRQHFAVRYDKFSYAHNRFVELDRDYRLNRQGKGRFLRLFADPENQLTFYKWFSPARGTLRAPANWPGAAETAHLADRELAPGKHDYLIEVEDFFGNRSVIRGQFIAGKKFKISPAFSRKHGVLLEAVHAPPDVNAEEIRIWKRSANGRIAWKPAHSFTVGGENGAAPLLDVLPLQLISGPGANGEMAFKISLTDAGGTASWPSFFYNAPADGMAEQPLSLRLEPAFYDDYVRIELHTSLPLKSDPLIEITRGDGSTIYTSVYRKGLMDYVVPLALKKIAGRHIRIVAQGESIGGKIAATQLVFDNMQIKKGEPGSITSADRLMRVEFSKTSLYRDLFGRIVRVRRLDELQEPLFRSHVYAAAPGDVPLNGGARVVLRYGAEIANPAQLGVYYQDRHGKWVFIDNRLDTLKHEVSAKVFSLEKFALGIDEQPPEVKIFAPVANRAVAPDALVRIYAKDDLSGFASEESLLLKIDGRKAIAEFDPENSLIVYRPRRPLAPGPHTLAFSAIDRCGNRTQVKRDFTVR